MCLTKHFAIRIKRIKCMWYLEKPHNFFALACSLIFAYSQWPKPRNEFGGSFTMNEVRTKKNKEYASLTLGVCVYVRVCGNSSYHQTNRQQYYDYNTKRIETVQMVTRVYICLQSLNNMPKCKRELWKLQHSLCLFSFFVHAMDR